jgi:inorganic pyrophosphatase/exopolyphosphatase
LIVNKLSFVRIWPVTKKVVSLLSKVPILENIYKNFNMSVMYKTNELSQKNQMYWSTARNEKPVYKNFAASKMSSAVKPNSIVEFTDFMGRKHKVSVRNNSELKKQMKFFAELKKESLTIKNIIAQYPIKLGRIEKRFLSEVRKELKSIGLTKRAIEIVLG